jgi:hypothetical protein
MTKQDKHFFYGNTKTLLLKAIYKNSCIAKYNGIFAELYVMRPTVDVSKIVSCEHGDNDFKTFLETCINPLYPRHSSDAGSKYTINSILHGPWA